MFSERHIGRSLQNLICALNINLSVCLYFRNDNIGRSLQENNFFCALYINLPFRLVGLSYAVEFLKDLGGDTRAVVGFNLGRMGWWYPAASGSYCNDNAQK